MNVFAKYSELLCGPDTEGKKTLKNLKVNREVL